MLVDVSLCFLSRVQCLSRQLPSGCVSWIPASQHKPCSSRKVLFPLFAPEWVGRRLWWAGKKKKKRASVVLSEGVLMGEEITPEFAHSSVQTHTPTFYWVYFAVLVDAEADFFMSPPLHTTTKHTYTPNTTPLLTPSPPRPPNPAQSASAWRRQSMLRAPLSVSTQGRAKGPSAGDCGKSDLWCPRCCWPVTFAPSLFVFSLCLSISLPSSLSFLRDLPV